MFQYLKELCITKNPKIYPEEIAVDFETAIQDAAKESGPL